MVREREHARETELKIGGEGERVSRRESLLDDGWHCILLEHVFLRNQKGAQDIIFSVSLSLFLSSFLLFIFA